MSGSKVLVAMSGGVDSSVTAALLCRRGYAVTGVTLEIWPEDAPLPAGETGCCSLAAVEDARKVAGIIGIPYYVFNFRPVFREKVIDYFVGEYLHGRTPNPCIACNRHIKFEALLRRARALGFDYVATGHYARCYRNADGRWHVRRAVDLEKDQTYVLYTFSQEQLARTLMPLGDFTKDQVRRMARDWGLPVAAKAESQEICFVTQGSYRDFLVSQGAKTSPGPVVDTAGRVLGEHLGLAFYTVGQRRGLGISTGYPLYVVELRPETNTLVVGPAEAVYRRGLVAEQNNFIALDRPTRSLEVQAQVRYRSRAASARLTPAGADRMVVEFARPQWAITPGQAVVYYTGDELVGGGTITEVL